MMGVFAEFERAMMRERVLAGLKRAKRQEARAPDDLVRKERAIRADLAAGLGFRRIMARHGVGTSVIQRIKAELAADAEGAASKDQQAD